MTGARAAEARKLCGLTQSEMAEWLGVTRNTISLWEHSDEVPLMYDRLVVMAIFIRGIWADSKLTRSVFGKDMIEKVVVALGFKLFMRL